MTTPSSRTPSVLQGRLTGTQRFAAVHLRDGVITSVAEQETCEPERAGDLWISPGWIDLQINGYRGANFSPSQPVAGDPAGVTAPIFEAAARAGVTSFCPTVVTQSREVMERNLRTLAGVLDSHRGMAAAAPGVHLEGPYLASEDGPRGAHPEQWVRDPDWDEFQRFQEASGGRIRLVTLAPEREGSLSFIERLTDAGITVALGHTGAAPERIREAVGAGAGMSTHLGNGAHAVLPRHPNYIWEQLAEDGLFASIIADGHHLPPAVVRCIARMKGPKRLALVSDVIALGGLPPGRYNDDRHEVLPSGKIVVAGTPYLVGASDMLDTCLSNLLAWSDFSLGEACATVSSVPAAIVPTGRRTGRIEPGYDADLTLFRRPQGGAVEVAATVRRGELVYLADGEVLPAGHAAAVTA